MPGACQLSGNVVPAVGMCEGAKPLRILCLDVARFKKSIRLPKITAIYSMHVSAINFFQTGLCPFWLPHTVGDPRDPPLS